MSVAPPDGPLVPAMLRTPEFTAGIDLVKRVLRDHIAPDRRIGHD